MRLEVASEADSYCELGKWPSPRFRATQCHGIRKYGDMVLQAGCKISQETKAQHGTLASRKKKKENKKM